jgi:hypothetical protein
MPNSISSADQTKTTPAEWLLARLTDPTRAAAIMGDLTEMAATRGRLWFWTAYARTLISLGWRTPVALVAAYACAKSYWVFTAIHSLALWLARWLPDADPRYFSNRWEVPLVTMLQGLVFLLPFVLVRFGPRDRLTRLACMFFLLSLLFTNRLSAFYLVGGLTAVAVPAALCLRASRRPMTVLLLALVPRYLMFRVFLFFLAAHQHDHSNVWRHGLFSALLLVPIAAAAVVCSMLHRWSLEQSEVSRPAELARGTNA